MGIVGRVVTMGVKEIVVKPMMKKHPETKSSKSVSFGSSLSKPATPVPFEHNKSTSLEPNDRLQSYPESWKAKTKVVAAEAYHSSGQELILEIGDLIIICGQEGNGWVNGLNLRSGHFGSFPSRCAQYKESISLSQFMQLRQEHLKKPGLKGSPPNLALSDAPPESASRDPFQVKNATNDSHPQLPPRSRAISNPITPSETTFASQKINGGMDSSSLVSLREAIETPPPVPQRSRAPTVTPGSNDAPPLPQRSRAPTATSGSVNAEDIPPLPQRSRAPTATSSSAVNAYDARPIVPTR